MEFRSQVQGRNEKVQANINGVWKTIGQVSYSGPGTKTYHARYFGVFGCVGEGIGIYGSAWAARNRVQKMAEEKIKPENILIPLTDETK